MTENPTPGVISRALCTASMLYHSQNSAIRNVYVRSGKSSRLLWLPNKHSIWDSQAYSLSKVSRNCLVLKSYRQKKSKRHIQLFSLALSLKFPPTRTLKQFEKSLIFWTWIMPMNFQLFFPETRDHSSCPLQGKKPRNAFGNRPGGGRRKAGCYSIFPCTSQPFVSAS